MQQEMRGGSGISWTICTWLQTDNHASTSTPHFLQADGVPDTKPTNAVTKNNAEFWLNTSALESTAGRMAKYESPGEFHLTANRKNRKTFPVTPLQHTCLVQWSEAPAAGLEQSCTWLDIVAFPLGQPVELFRRHREHHLKLRHFQVALHTRTRQGDWG